MRRRRRRCVLLSGCSAGPRLRRADSDPSRQKRRKVGSWTTGIEQKISRCEKTKAFALVVLPCLSIAHETHQQKNEQADRTEKNQNSSSPRFLSHDTQSRAMRPCDHERAYQTD